MDAPRSRATAPVGLIAALFILLILLSGCLIKSGGTEISTSQNQTNILNQSGNISNNQSSNQSATNAPGNVSANQTGNQYDNSTGNLTQGGPYQRFYFKDFSFEYPITLSVSNTSTVFAGEHNLLNSTAEVMVVSVIDTKQAYGIPKDDELKGNPTKAAADFLTSDKKSDPVGLLGNAYEYGSISTFSIGRDAYVAELPFKIHFEGFQSRYVGYALSFYIPERSIQLRVRIVALDPVVGESIRNMFIDTFRMEKG
jgi:hypothetical protein